MRAVPGALRERVLAGGADELELPAAAEYAAGRADYRAAAAENPAERG